MNEIYCFSKNWYNKDKCALIGTCVKRDKVTHWNIPIQIGDFWGGAFWPLEGAWIWPKSDAMIMIIMMLFLSTRYFLFIVF